MIEELCEYLVRHGWDDDIADEIHDAYYHGDVEGVRQMSDGIGGEELVAKVRQWQASVGEITPASFWGRFVE